MLFKLSLMAIAVVFIGSGLGATAYAWKNGPLFDPPLIQDAPRAVTAVAAPKTPPVDAIGSEYRLAAPKGYPTSFLWINHTALWLWNEAYKERDESRELSVMRQYEHLEVPNATRVQVVGRQGDAIQLEMLEGPLNGRRGWTDHPVAASVRPQDEPPPIAMAPAGSSVPCDLCGQRRRLHHRNMTGWAAATKRLSTDVLRRAMYDDARDWVMVADGQFVTVIQVDGDVAEVELFGGGINGTRVWVPLEDLGN